MLGATRKYKTKMEVEKEEEKEEEEEEEKDNYFNIASYYYLFFYLLENRKAKFCHIPYWSNSSLLFLSNSKV